MPNPFHLLRKYFKKPAVVPANLALGKVSLSDKEKEQLHNLGVFIQDLQQLINQNTAINWERSHLYREIDRALINPLIGAAIELYADTCTAYNRFENATVWVGSESEVYKNKLESLFDNIGIEERIFDWAYQLGAFGDLFVKINAIPGIGITSIEDGEHPLNVSRVDKDGLLIGFYQTPMGLSSGESKKLLPPWEYVHLRILGAKKRRPLWSDPSYAEYKSITLLSPDVRRLTTKYGSSLLLNAIPVYKRMRLAEDSLLLARLSKGVMRYIFKVGVDSCLEGNTKIKLLNGTQPTIAEMAVKPEDFIGKYVWTVNEKTKALQPKKILNVKKTRLNAAIVRVHLDNGKYVDCTSDHRFMLRDGRYLEAQCLQPGQSLMPYYEQIGHKYLSKYRRVYDPQLVLNHKVVRVEWLPERKDTYDIQIEGTPNFPLEAGVFVHNSNIEAVSEIMEDYKVLLKRTRAIDTSNQSPNFIDNFEVMDVLTDLVIPVWGDVNNLMVEKLGGETDIKWIADIDEMRNQLATALRVPLPLLGGYVSEMPGGLGRSAVERLDIRFARSARRLQRALIEGVKRICQIHLAYQNMAADFGMFDIHMSETSTAEEEELKDALDKGVDIVDKIMDLLDKVIGSDLDKMTALDYLNQKVLKLTDLDLYGLIKNKDSELAKKIGEKIKVRQELKEKKAYNSPNNLITNMDLIAHTPLKEGIKSEGAWREAYGTCTVTEEVILVENGKAKR